MTGPITAAEQITPEWLTTVLQHAGVLESGRVEATTIAGNPAFNSAVSHLAVSYSPDAPPDAPRALLFKRNLPEDWAREAGRDEVSFYAAMIGAKDRLPIVPCYHAAYDPETRDSSLLLLDISASHEPPVSRDDLIALRGVPSEARLEAVAGALASIHGYW